MDNATNNTDPTPIGQAAAAADPGSRSDNSADVAAVGAAAAGDIIVDEPLPPADAIEVTPPPAQPIPNTGTRGPGIATGQNATANAAVAGAAAAAAPSIGQILNAGTPELVPDLQHMQLEIREAGQQILGQFLATTKGIATDADALELCKRVALRLADLSYQSIHSTSQQEITDLAQRRAMALATLRNIGQADAITIETAMVDAVRQTFVKALDFAIGNLPAVLSRLHV